MSTPHVLEPTRYHALHSVSKGSSRQAGFARGGHKSYRLLEHGIPPTRLRPGVSLHDHILAGPPAVPADGRLTNSLTDAAAHHQRASTKLKHHVLFDRHRCVLLLTEVCGGLFTSGVLLAYLRSRRPYALPARPTSNNCYYEHSTPASGVEPNAPAQPQEHSHTTRSCAALRA